MKPFRRRRSLQGVERLEPRRVMATFVVTHTADNGIGSLRWALNQANGNAGPDAIEFQIEANDPGFVDVDSHLPGGDPERDAFVIRAQSPLPTIVDDTGGTVLNGHSQRSFGGDTNPFGPEITLDGNALNMRGLEIRSAKNQIVGINVRNFGQSGIVIRGSENWIAGSYIGTDATGTSPAGNAQIANFWGGIQINGPGNLVGSNGDGVDDSAERNVISGNQGRGIWISGADAHQNQVAGNYIGVDASGLTALSNLTEGISLVSGAHSNHVGVDSAGTAHESQRNVISGNGQAGIAIRSGSSANSIAGNYIGVNVLGNAGIGNGGDGVVIAGSGSNVIGATGAGASLAHRNVISGNGGLAGVQITSGHENVVAGNYIGTDATGSFALGNRGAHGGVSLVSASRNVIGTNGDGVADAVERNVISGNQGFFAGLMINAHDNVMAGNLIGVDALGTNALGNQGHGVGVMDGSSGNRIGTDGDETSDELERNVISASGGFGVWIGSQNSRQNVVAGNFIGTDISGMIALGNGNHGVRVGPTASENRIGTDGDGVGDLAERNLISGNKNHAVQIIGADSAGNTVAGNYIGSDVSGRAAIPSTGAGIVILDAPRSVIGGATARHGNLILGNTAEGIRLVGSASDTGIFNNEIALNRLTGVSVFHEVAGTTIRLNSIHSNGHIGIDLQGNGLTPNDRGDADGGANHLQNFPGIGQVISGETTRILGTHQSMPDSTYTLDFYATPSADPSRAGEGLRYLGSTVLVTDEAGIASFDVTLIADTNPSEVVTATATDSEGNTSEFSNRLPMADVGGPYTVAESSTITLDGSASFDFETNSLAFAWDLDNDQEFDDATAPFAAFSATELDGPTSRVVRLQVTDASGLFTEVATTVDIVNVAPSVTITGPLRVERGEVVEYHLQALDPSQADQAAGFTYDIDWNGDGTVDQTVAGSDFLTVGHVYDFAGATTVTVTATDKDAAHSAPVTLDVKIIQSLVVDIKPGNDHNRVNIKSKGVIPVAIYGTLELNAATILGDSVRLAGVAADHFALQDLDDDGDLDLILHFRTQKILDAVAVDTAFAEGELIELELQGQTSTGIELIGSDWIDLFLSGSGKPTGRP